MIEKHETEIQEKNKLIEQLKKSLSVADETHKEKLMQAKEEFSQKMITLQNQLKEFKQVNWDE